VKAWLLLAVIIASTVTADLLQSHEMKRHGEIHDFRPSGLRLLLVTLARNKYLILSVACMAASFFAFMALVQVADLSFAVPASAGSLVIETILARLILKEHVNSRRWMGAALVAGGVWCLSLGAKGKCDPPGHRRDRRGVSSIRHCGMSRVPKGSDARLQTPD